MSPNFFGEWDLRVNLCAPISLFCLDVAAQVGSGMKCCIVTSLSEYVLRR